MDLQLICSTDSVMYKEWINAKLLSAALLGGNSQYIKTLLEAGADVNTFDERTEYTPLMLAAQNGDYKSVKTLLDAGADVERKKDLFLTALIYAACNKMRNVECVKLLVQAGADVYARNNMGRCPLLLAALAGNYTIVEFLLLKGNNVDACDSQGRSALSLACVAGCDQIVKLLMESGASVNFASDKGMTPLMHAANKGRMKCTKILLEAGADISLCDNYGNNTIMWATTCNNHDISCVSLLKQAGAVFTAQDLNAMNSFDDTPLMYASHNGDIKSMKVLMELGADVEGKKQNGHSALLSAAHNKLRDPGCVRELLEAGANVNACDNYGSNALMVAASDGHNKIIQVLLDAGTDVNAVDIDGKSALSLASLSGYDDTVKLLIESGADVNLASYDGTTPLMRVANKGNIKSAIHLLKAGADIDMADKYGNTALMWAMTSNFNDHSCVCLLAQAGANQPKNMSNHCSSLLYDVKKLLLKEAGQFDLQHQCRKVIRRQLLWTHEDSNLVPTVSRLPLPTAIKSYLLYYEPKDTNDKNTWAISISFFGDNFYDMLPKPRKILTNRKTGPTMNGKNRKIDENEQNLASKVVKTKGYRRMALLCNTFAG